MIDEIRLTNVALIREAEMVPARGLTVVTGESGSGKTAFLSGLKLLVGERGSSDMVREGEDGLVVEGRVFSRRPDGDDEGIVVFRSLGADGRSRVRVNGSMATVRDVAAAVGASVDLCGQHEHQRLMHPASQCRMLDAWAGEALSVALASYRDALHAAACAREALDELRELGRADSARVEEARFALRRIGEVDPQPGEYEELLAEARRMENLEDLARATAGARDLLSGDGGALESAGQAASLLESASAFDGRLGNAARSLREAGFILEDAAREVDALAPDSDAFDPARLGEVQERLSAFQGLIRAFGPSIEGVLSARAEAEEVVSAVDDGDIRLESARRELERAEGVLAAAAEAVTEARRTAAPAFEEAVNGVLEQLEMPGCRLTCRIDPLERSRWGEQGPDAVQFLFRPGAGLEPRPLNRIASGGELSRVTLAVKVVLGDADDVDTLVFDEVDAGVGGKAALAVGRVLSRLARTHQVIVVTHLAQIAVLGDVHYVVERVGADAAETLMRPVEGSERIREVARMLSGSADPASLVHAEGLLRTAR